MQVSTDYIVSLDGLSMADVPRVGGKNASLGEMIGNLSGMGVKVPGGFATTAQAFWDFLDHNDLRARIHARLAALDVAIAHGVADADASRTYPAASTFDRLAAHAQLADHGTRLNSLLVQVHDGLVTS